jgi:hypothetical protein
MKSSVGVSSARLALDLGPHVEELALAELDLLAATDEAGPSANDEIELLLAAELELVVGHDELLA